MTPQLTTLAAATVATTTTTTTTTGAMSPDDDRWRFALCRSSELAPGLFFSDELADIGEAKRVCSQCPLVAACLEGALRRAEPCGVWGGQLFDRGRVIGQKRRRGRPPKHPRPEEQLPDVPIPDHLRRLIA